MLATVPRLGLCIINVLFAIFSGIAFAFGLWSHFDPVNFQWISSRFAFIPRYTVFLQLCLKPVTWNLSLWNIITLLSGIIFVVSIFGFGGAYLNSQCILAIYVVITATFLILFSFGSLLSVSDKLTTTNILYNTLMDSLLLNYGKENNFDTEFWDQIMINRQCCGVNNSTDFENAQWMNLHPNKTVPAACCKLNDVEKVILLDSNCTSTPTNRSSNMNHGCISEINSFFQKNQVTLFTIATSVLLLLTFLILSAACIVKFSPVRSKTDWKAKRSEVGVETDTTDWLFECRNKLYQPKNSNPSDGDVESICFSKSDQAGDGIFQEIENHRKYYH